MAISYFIVHGRQGLNQMPLWFPGAQERVGPRAGWMLCVPFEGFWRPLGLVGLGGPTACPSCRGAWSLMGVKEAWL